MRVTNATITRLQKELYNGRDINISMYNIQQLKKLLMNIDADHTIINPIEYDYNTYVMLKSKIVKELRIKKIKKVIKNEMRIRDI